ncbi:MAG: BlaI/MecI/CopY family transcriptional regulator, partial [Acidobacteriota bacterium]
MASRSATDFVGGTGEPMMTSNQTPTSPTPASPGEPLGDRETDLLQALWGLGRPATVTEVQESLRARGHRVAYTTVQTMLNRLEKKGRVERSKEGKAHLYAAAVSE